MPGGRPPKTIGFDRIAIGIKCEEMHERQAREVADNRLALRYRVIAYSRSGRRDEPPIVAAKLRGLPRFYSSPLRRPKGVRQKIIDAVAREIGVSSRHVETCWKEYRQIQRRLDRD